LQAARAIDVVRLSIIYDACATVNYVLNVCTYCSLKNATLQRSGKRAKDCFVN